MVDKAQHVVVGSGAPTQAPPSLQAHYLDTVTKDIYLATGTASHEDWKLYEDGKDGLSPEIRATETHIQWRLQGGETWTDIVALSDLRPTTSDLVAAVVEQLQGRLLPAGGDEGQALTKVSAADYDVAWGVPPEMMLIVYAYDTWNNNQSDMRAGYLDMETYGFTPVTWPDAGNSALPGEIGYSKSAGLLAVSPLYSSTAYILNAATLAVEQTSIDLAGYGALAMDPAGTTVVCAANGGLGVAEIATLGTVDYDVSTRSGSQPGTFSPDGSRYYSPHNAGIDVFDTATWTLAAGESYTGSSCRLFTLSADGTRAACRHGSVIRMFNVSDWSTVADFALPDLNNWSDCVPLRFHPNSNDVLAVACRVDTGGGLIQCAVVYDATAPSTPLATIIPENDSGNDRVDGGAQIRFNAAGTKMFLSCYVGLYVYDATDWTYITALGIGEYDQASLVAL